MVPLVYLCRVWSNICLSC